MNAHDLILAPPSYLINVILILLWFITPGLTVSTPGGNIRRGDCLARKWTPPQRLTADGRLALDQDALRFSSGAARSTRVVLAGNQMPNLYDLRRGQGALSVYLDGEKLSSVPTGPFSFAHPKVALDAAGDVHLFWADLSDQRSRGNLVDWIAPQSENLWTARYSQRAGWTNAERLMNQPVIWSKPFVDEIAAWGATLALTVVRMPGRDGTNGVTLLRYDGTRWVARDIAGTADAGASSVAIDRERIVVLFSAAGRSGRPRSNSLFALESRDGGNSWSLPFTLADEVGVSFASPRLRLTAEHGLQAFWTQRESTGGIAVHMRQLDQDLARPVTSQVFRIAGYVNLPQLVVDDCDRVHVVFESYDPGSERGSMMHVWWDGAWSSVSPLLPSLRVLDAVALPDSGGGVRLYFLGQPQDAPARSDYNSYSSHWRPERP